MNDKASKKSRLDMVAIRARLESARGQEYWRSLEELAETEEFREFLHNEFPRQSAPWAESLGRRDLLKLMGASLALTGLSACTTQPVEKIVPYVRAPEDIVPGEPQFYATAMTLGGYGYPVLVENHLGRPTKVEGNSEHPASLGAAGIFAQASVLGLYDPDRSRAVFHNARLSSWVSFQAAVNTEREVLLAQRGEGLRILTETVTSPTLASQIRALLAEFPLAKWHQWEPVGGDQVHEGSRLAFGEPLNTLYDFDKADVILALDADFLASGPGSLAYARAWAARRQVELGHNEMNRLYVLESTPSNTGAVADHRLPLRAAEIENFALAVAKGVGVPVDAAGEPPGHSRWIRVLVEDLLAHRGRSLIVAGDTQPPAVHALAHVMNHALGNVGSTVSYTDPVEAEPVNQTRSLLQLTEDMRAGKVKLLVIVGGNPVFSAPADSDFERSLSAVEQKIHLSLYRDETSQFCNWHLPEAHYLEAWSDVRAFDGTTTIVQPLIAPLYDGKSAHELLSVLLGKSGVPGYDSVREHWKTVHSGAEFEKIWRRALHAGLVEGTKLSPRSVTPGTGWMTEVFGGRANVAATDANLEIIFRPDPAIWDGRFANNGWLQELPRPLTKLTWDNAVLIGPATAERLGIRARELVRLRYRGAQVQAPAWIVPGQPENSVTVHLGHGRSQAGKVGSGTGFNAYLLRMSDAPWFGSKVELEKIGAESALAVTQDHHSMEGRHLVREGTVEEFKKDPAFAREMGEEPPKDMTLYPGFEYPGNAWGMVVNLGSCIGCNACVVACQAENNSPVVGKEQVALGREMQWMRIDRYYRGDLENPSVSFQPVMCHHCENAPCEVVCPVAATSHSAEGLNQMVYNRCVGTRYCSNNCPYKVRRFNFLQYTDWETPSLKPLRNPDVTVRGRGVMEKCTYCVQRINAVKIRAEKEDRPIRDGEIVTACQGACPTGAIVFGNINDPRSRVAGQKESPLNYGLLAELNTRPRTSYLARIRNPNPSLEKE